MLDVTALETDKFAPSVAAIAKLLTPTESCVLVIFPVLVTPAPTVAVVCTSKVIVPVALAASVPPVNSVTVAPPAADAGAAVGVPFTIKLLIELAAVWVGKISVIEMPLAGKVDKF